MVEADSTTLPYMKVGKVSSAATAVNAVISISHGAAPQQDRLSLWQALRASLRGFQPAAAEQQYHNYVAKANAPLARYAVLFMPALALSASCREMMEGRISSCFPMFCASFPFLVLFFISALLPAAYSHRVLNERSYQLANTWLALTKGLQGLGMLHIPCTVLPFVQYRVDVAGEAIVQPLWQRMRLRTSGLCFLLYLVCNTVFYHGVPGLTTSYLTAFFYSVQLGLVSIAMTCLIDAMSRASYLQAHGTEETGLSHDASNVTCASSTCRAQPLHLRHTSTADDIVGDVKVAMAKASPAAATCIPAAAATTLAAATPKSPFYLGRVDHHSVTSSPGHSSGLDGWRALTDKHSTGLGGRGSNLLLENSARALSDCSALAVVLDEGPSPSCALASQEFGSNMHAAVRERASTGSPGSQGHKKKSYMGAQAPLAPAPAEHQAAVAADVKITAPGVAGKGNAVSSSLPRAVPSLHQPQQQAGVTTLVSGHAHGTTPSATAADEAGGSAATALTLSRVGSFHTMIGPVADFAGNAKSTADSLDVSIHGVVARSTPASQIPDFLRAAVAAAAAQASAASAAGTARAPSYRRPCGVSRSMINCKIPYADPAHLQPEALQRFMDSMHGRPGAPIIWSISVRAGCIELTIELQQDPELLQAGAAPIAAERMLASLPPHAIMERLPLTLEPPQGATVLIQDAHSAFLAVYNRHGSVAEGGNWASAPLPVPSVASARSLTAKVGFRSDVAALLTPCFAPTGNSSATAAAAAALPITTAAVAVAAPAVTAADAATNTEDAVTTLPSVLCREHSSAATSAVTTAQTALPSAAFGSVTSAGSSASKSAGSSTSVAASGSASTLKADTKAAATSVPAPCPVLYASAAYWPPGAELQVRCGVDYLPATIAILESGSGRGSKGRAPACALGSTPVASIPACAADLKYNPLVLARVNSCGPVQLVIQLQQQITTETCLTLEMWVAAPTAIAAGVEHAQQMVGSVEVLLSRQADVVQELCSAGGDGLDPDGGSCSNGLARDANGLDEEEEGVVSPFFLQDLGSWLGWVDEETVTAPVAHRGMPAPLLRLHRSVHRSEMLRAGIPLLLHCVSVGLHACADMLMTRMLERGVSAAQIAAAVNEASDEFGAGQQADWGSIAGVAAAVASSVDSPLYTAVTEDAVFAGICPRDLLPQLSSLSADNSRHANAGNHPAVRGAGVCHAGGGNGGDGSGHSSTLAVVRVGGVYPGELQKRTMRSVMAGWYHSCAGGGLAAAQRAVSAADTCILGKREASQGSADGSEASSSTASSDATGLADAGVRRRAPRSAQSEDSVADKREVATACDGRDRSSDGRALVTCASDACMTEMCADLSDPRALSSVGEQAHARNIKRRALHASLFYFPLPAMEARYVSAVASGNATVAYRAIHMLPFVCAFALYRECSRGCFGSALTVALVALPHTLCALTTDLFPERRATVLREQTYFKVTCFLAAVKLAVACGVLSVISSSYTDMAYYQEAIMEGITVAMWQKVRGPSAFPTRFLYTCATAGVYLRIGLVPGPLAAFLRAASWNVVALLISFALDTYNRAAFLRRDAVAAAAVSQASGSHQGKL